MGNYFRKCLLKMFFCSSIILMSICYEKCKKCKKELTELGVGEDEDVFKKLYKKRNDT